MHFVKSSSPLAKLGIDDCSGSSSGDMFVEVVYRSSRLCCMYLSWDWFGYKQGTITANMLGTVPLVV